uniref:Uncharacterized protein n=1 Tax=Aegilops tauschii subsp. strangulata TaxID=200361 RepID=A0A453SDQ6_AEGTS
HRCQHRRPPATADPASKANLPLDNNLLNINQRIADSKLKKQSVLTVTLHLDVCAQLLEGPPGEDHRLHRQPGQHPGLPRRGVPLLLRQQDPYPAGRAVQHPDRLLRRPAARGRRRLHQRHRRQEGEVRLHRLPGQGVRRRRAHLRVRRRRAGRHVEEGQLRLPLLGG